MMHPFVTILSIVLFFIVLWDALETVVIPRRVTRRFRLTRFFYRTVWTPWSWFARRLPAGSWRDGFLSIFGPLSLLVLLAIWASGLIFSFALFQWSLGSPINAPEQQITFSSDLYLSASTFFTLGLGDVVPRTNLSRAITVIEAGTGFGFLALVIGYLPVLYQAFSRREVDISLLDARGGSPPTAVELLRRQVTASNKDELSEFLGDWEIWSADLLESHLSYPVLAYYRSQHSNQSWLGALTAVLDVCALVIVGIDKTRVQQAQLTFAMARHAIVDLAQILGRRPATPRVDRLSPTDLQDLREILTANGLSLREGEEADHKLSALRRMYEPYLYSLAEFLVINLPPWFLKKHMSDNWQTSAWERVSSTRPLQSPDPDDHF